MLEEQNLDWVCGWGHFKFEVCIGQDYEGKQIVQ